MLRLSVLSNDATDDALLVVTEPLAGRHHPVRDARKRVKAVRHGTYVCKP